MAQLADRYDHVIVGGGVAADTAARAIHETAPDASIAILSADVDPPVYRPAITKDLWRGEDPDPASQDLHTAAETGATLVTDTRVTSLDPAMHTVSLAAGDVIGYGRLLLATGSVPRRFGAVADQRVLTVRTVADYRRLREVAADGARIAVVGGGYIGSEIAAGLSTTGAQVSLLTPDPTVLARMFPASITAHLEQVYEQHGVSLQHRFRLESIDTGTELTLHAEDGRTVAADAVVLGLGVDLDLALAEGAGLTVEDGTVLVDEQLRTSAEDVWAAGDIIGFTDPLYGRRHVEHVDNAWQSGTVAGTVMAGGDARYEYTPLFFSDLFEDGYEAIGHLDASLEVVETWNEDGSAAVVQYLEDGRIAGTLLWNTWDSVPAARELAAASRDGKISAEQLAERSYDEALSLP